MKTEFEVKILEINVDEIVKKLGSLGAKKIIERKMRRYVYDIEPGNPNLWLRLRDDGERITLTVKEIKGKGVDGTKEIEVDVDNFEKMNEILNKLGFFHKAYQENKRISYKLGSIEIEIDFWPKIPAYLEIEGESVEDVEKTVEFLGFKMSQTTTLNTYEIYKNKGIDIFKIKELKF